MATEPMTAAEARKLVVWPYGTSERILAALEEREALLGERDRLQGDVENFRRLARIRLKRVEQLEDDVTQLKVEVEDWKELHGQASSRAEFQKADASVGALVRRIGELQPSAYLTWAGHPMCYYVKHPSVLQSALDSLLPKEPEPKWSGLAPSGGRYRVRGGLLYADDGIEMGQVARVGVEDIPFVAALLEASRGN